MVATTGTRVKRSIPRIALAAPAVALQALLLFVPLLLAVVLSFTNWNGFSPSFSFVGIQNYLRVFSDSDVSRAAVVTAILAVVGTIGCNAFGLGIALLLNKSSRINSVLRAIFFYPQVLSPLVIGFIWGTFLASQGVANSILTQSGLDAVPFLSDPNIAVASIAIVLIWSHFGVNIVLYLAGLQTIPPALLEAARMDGASTSKTFRHVTLPLLAPIVTLNVVLVLVSFIRTYDVVLSLTDGGPAGRTRTIAYLILNDSIKNGQMGFGSAQAVVLALVTGVIAILIILIRRRADAAIES